MLIERILLYNEVFKVLLTFLCLKEVTEFTKLVMFLVVFFVFFVVFFCFLFCILRTVANEKFLKLTRKILRVCSAEYSTYVSA